MDSDSIFSELTETLGGLLDELRSVYEVVFPSEDINEKDSFSTLKDHHTDFFNEENRPLIVTLFGPSGSGKSTIFSLLTGINVATSDSERPTSRYPMFALPSNSKPELIDKIPGDWDWKELVDPNDLKTENHPIDRAYFGQMESQAHANHGYILVDVPDINSVEKSNWQKAEKVLARSEIVVFVVHKEDYSSQGVMDYLCGACSSTSILVYLVSKIDRTAENTDWRELLEKAVQGYQPENESIAKGSFDTQRIGGKTRGEFIKKEAHFYSSKYSEEPRIEEIIPLDPGSPKLFDLLDYKKVEEIRLRKKLGVIQEEMEFVTKTIKSAKERLQVTSNVISGLESALGSMDIFAKENRDSLRKVVPIPLNEFRDEFIAAEQNKAREEGRSNNPWTWIKRGNNTIHKGIKEGAKWVKKKTSLISWPGRIADFLKSKEEGEVETPTYVSFDEYVSAEMDKAIESLEKAVRTIVKKSDSEYIQVPSESAFVKTHESFRDSDWPGGSDEWKDYMKREADLLVKENPKLYFWIRNAQDIQDIGTFIGGPVLVIFAGPVGAIAAVSAVVLNFKYRNKTEKMILEKKLLEWTQTWMALREPQLKEHIKEEYLRPLILEEQEQRRDKIKGAPLPVCEQHIKKLNTIIEDHREIPATEHQHGC